nr:hypothetical protein [uncultured Achromobacter sp.]
MIVNKIRETLDTKFKSDADKPRLKTLHPPRGGVIAAPGGCLGPDGMDLAW